MALINLLCCLMLATVNISDTINDDIDQQVCELIKAKGIVGKASSLQFCDWVEPTRFELDDKIYIRTFIKGGKRKYQSEDVEIVLYLHIEKGTCEDLLRNVLVGYINCSSRAIGSPIDSAAASFSVRDESGATVIESRGCAYIILNGICLKVRSTECFNVMKYAKAILEAGLKKAEEEK